MAEKRAFGMNGAKTGRVLSGAFVCVSPTKSVAVFLGRVDL